MDKPANKEQKPPHAQYFEGTLQLRNPTKELIEFVDRELEKRNVFITKRQKHKDGIDLYVTSQKAMQIIGKRLKENFKGEYKFSSTLHTRDSQNNKDLYRITVFFKLHDIKTGKIMNYRGEKVKIVSWGRRVSVKDLKTGKRFLVDFKELK